MLSNAEIEQLLYTFRQQYDEVYVTTIGDEDFVWRALTRKEYIYIRDIAQNEYDAFERICNTVVLYPKYNFATTAQAYLPEQLAPQIIEESGYGDWRKDGYLLSLFRQQMKGFEQQAECVIKRAFPDITFDEMASWTKEKFIKYLAKAEWSLKNIDGITAVHFLTPDEQSAAADEQGEEEPVMEPQIDIMELAMEIRKQGRDPMFVLRHLYQKEKPSYFERPLIGGEKQGDTMLAGIDAWKGEGFDYGRYNIIQQQVQKVSRR